MQPITPLIIFGMRPRTTDIEGGTFVCPQCGGTHAYEHKKVRPYFTLYFVPLIPLGAGEEYVQCQNCGTTFPVDVLSMKIKPKRVIRPLSEQLNTLHSRLVEGYPIEYVIADLTAGGLDRDIAENNVRQSIGDMWRHCPDCGLNYAPNVERCKEDDTLLE